MHTTSKKFKRAFVRDFFLPQAFKSFSGWGGGGHASLCVLYMYIYLSVLNENCGEIDHIFIEGSNKFEDTDDFSYKEFISRESFYMFTQRYIA